MKLYTLDVCSTGLISYSIFETKELIKSFFFELLLTSIMERSKAIQVFQLKRMKENKSSNLKWCNWLKKESQRWSNKANSHRQIHLQKGLKLKQVKLPSGSQLNFASESNAQISYSRNFCINLLSTNLKSNSMKIFKLSS